MFLIRLCDKMMYSICPTKMPGEIFSSLLSVRSKYSKESGSENEPRLNVVNEVVGQV